MAIVKLRWSVFSGILCSITVFISSIMVNEIVTSFVRSGISFIFGLFLGLFFYTIWSFIVIDFKREKDNKKMVKE